VIVPASIGIVPKSSVGSIAANLTGADAFGVIQLSLHMPGRSGHVGAKWSLVEGDAVEVKSWFFSSTRLLAEFDGWY
jgi:hypothetical protein